MKTKRVEFALPDNFSVPEGMTAGEDFDVVCTLRLKPDGSVCLVMLGDTQMPGYNDVKGVSNDRPDYSGAAKQMAGSGNDEDGDET